MHNQPPADDDQSTWRRQDDELPVADRPHIPAYVFYIAAGLALAFLLLTIYRAATTPPDTSTTPALTPGVSATPSPASSAPIWRTTVSSRD